MLETYAAAGVNRVSIGVQSMVPHVLAALGPDARPGERRAGGRGGARGRAADVQRRPDLRRRRGSRSADWRTTLRAGARARSAARVGVRPHRRGRHAARRRPGPPSRRRRAGRRLRARRRAADAPPGWPTTRCRTGPDPATSAGTTFCTGRRTTTSAFGCAAHSHRAGRRWWNVRTPERYIAAVRAGRPTEAAGETLAPDARRVEGLQLSLRTRAGVPLEALDGDDLARARRAGRRPLAPDPPRPPPGQRGRPAPPLSCRASLVAEDSAARAPQVSPAVGGPTRCPRAHRGLSRPPPSGSGRRRSYSDLPVLDAEAASVREESTARRVAAIAAAGRAAVLNRRHDAVVGMRRLSRELFAEALPDYAELQRRWATEVELVSGRFPPRRRAPRSR